MTASDSGGETLYTLSAAAERLNVHPTTLRRWANNGDVRVVLTPGGHRRFPDSEIQRLLSQTDASTPPSASNNPALMDRALETTRRELDHQPDPQWLQQLDDEERATRRQTGRRLLGLLMQYISCEDGSDLLNEARGIGRQYAIESKKGGISLSDAMNATLFFRDNIVESALLLPESAQNRPAENRRLLRRMNEFLNAIQLAIAEEYDRR
ncbi:MAG: helix-turn-helix domain-containing protein [Bacteroidota bacterium]